MLEKQRGLIPCAHCGERQSTLPCLLCTRMVCDVCSADVATCIEPRPQHLVLAGGSRVVGVDLRGERALFVDRRGLVQHLELQAGAERDYPELETREHKRLKLGDAGPCCCLLSSGQLVSLRRETHNVTSYQAEHQRIKVLVRWPDQRPRVVHEEEDLRQVKPWLFPSDREQRVNVVRGARVDEIQVGANPRHLRTSRASGEITLGASSDERNALAAFSRDGVLHLFSDDHPVTIPLTGHACLLRFTSNGLLLATRLAPMPAYSRRPGRLAHRLQLSLIHPDPDVPGEVATTLLPFDLTANLDRPAHAAATADGRLVAVRGPDVRTVTVLDLVDGHTQRLSVPDEGVVKRSCTQARRRGLLTQTLLHGLRVNWRQEGAIDLIRFVDDDRRLVTTTDRGDVVVWYLRQGRVFTG